jgi:hypothetical protein
MQVAIERSRALYFRGCRPWERASLIIDNDNLAAPFIVPEP